MECRRTDRQMGLVLEWPGLSYNLTVSERRLMTRRKKVCQNLSRAQEKKNLEVLVAIRRLFSPHETWNLQDELHDKRTSLHIVPSRRGAVSAWLARARTCLTEAWCRELQIERVLRLCKQIMYFSELLVKAVPLRSWWLSRRRVDQPLRMWRSVRVRKTWCLYSRWRDGRWILDSPVRFASGPTVSQQLWLLCEKWPV